MLQALRQRAERDEEGFTLIELMVVVLIIAILIAIAIPTFLGARQRAQDRAAQSNLRNALTAEKTYYTDQQVYTNSSASMVSIEPSISWGAAALSATGNVVLTSLADTNSTVCLSALSASGKTFEIMDVSGSTNAGTYYWGGTSGAPTCGQSSVASWNTHF
jgi:type IV pilus assembly protein PilA